MPGPAAPIYDAKDVIGLILSQTNLVNALWGIYAAVSFTAAGFGVTLHTAKPEHVTLLSVLAAAGFGVFLYGHWKMIRGPVLVIETAAGELRATLEQAGSNDADPFKETVSALIRHTYAVSPSGWAHLAIDCCSMGVLLVAPTLSASAGTG